MARQRITEFHAKTILLRSLNLPYDGIFLTDSESEAEKIERLDPRKKYVFKVDDGIKKRMKKGLIAINATPQEILKAWESFKRQGYRRFLIEEFVEHRPEEEKFLSLERTREGLAIYYSNKGGIDIEENQDKIRKDILTSKNIAKIAEFLGLSPQTLQTIRETFDDFYFSFLEVNPFVVKDSKVYLLDLAVEVDSTAMFFVRDLWSQEDFVTGDAKVKSEEEKAVESLSRKSQAALKLDLLNPNGSIFVLLSGGGASIVLADEVYNLGFGKELGNYGEYSGNPNEEETYIYAKNILSLLLKSKARKKVLIIGGGVANFTDIRITFNGIIRAIDEVKDKLKTQKLKVFVRRGGPHADEALRLMEEFLKQEGLFGKVSGPDMILTEIVKQGLDWVKS
ncbi:MAG: ATP citrate lyase citrate-binding domain-containing protein [bacterium]|nr:ATP citrate lyase citrate-binding domain-containing protein [bacterium]